MFRDWKADPVTKSAFEMINDNIQRLQTELGESAGSDALQDRWKCGVIAGYRDLLLINFAEVENDN